MEAISCELPEPVWKLRVFRPGEYSTEKDVTQSAYRYQLSAHRMTGAFVDYWGAMTTAACVAGTVLAALALTLLAVSNSEWALAGFGALVFAFLIYGTSRRFIRGRSVPAAAWHLGLLIFPLVCALRTVNLTAALAVMVLLAFSTFLHRPPEGAGYGRVWPVVVLCLAFASVIFRPATVPAGLFLAFALVFLIRATPRVTRQSAVTSLIDGVGLYLIANVVGYYALGMRSPGEALRSGGLEAADGGIRIIYPLATSLNLPPILAAAFLAASLILLERGAKRLLRFAGAVAACVVLIGADSRTALAVAAAVAAASLVAPRLLRLSAIPLAVGAVVFVFGFPVIARPIVAPTITWLISMLPSLSREAVSSSDVSLNGRQYIWEKSLRFWGDRTSEWGEVFGYGAQGQYYSGASRTYAHIFGSSIQNPKMASTHNSVLQQLFDAGIIGAALLALAIIACVALWVVLSRTDEPYTAAALALVLSLVISGVTEVSLAPGVGQETLLLFAGLVIAACSAGLQKEAARNGLHDRAGRILPVRPVTPDPLPPRSVIGHASSTSLTR